MKRFVLAAALFLSGSAAPAQPLAFPEPIARAAAGDIQCYMPDTRRKTCWMASRYRRMESGVIEMVTLMVVTKTMAMEVAEPVEIHGDKVCSVMLQSELDAARFVTLDGKPADDEQVRKLRVVIGKDVGKYFNHLMCTAYEDLGRNFVATQTLDGQRVNEREVIPMIWVRADEGYQVQP